MQHRPMRAERLHRGPHSMTTSAVRLSVADAATRLGISTDTVRRKLKRGQLQAKRDNHGQWWVEIPADAKPAEPMQRAAYEPKPDADARLAEELRIQIKRLGADLDAAYARETAERERHAAEIARLDGLLVAERARVDELLKRRGFWDWVRRSV